MKLVYPVVMTKTQNGVLVYVPDFDCNTQGKDYLEAIDMARDAISLMAIDYEDDGKALPKADFDIKADDGQIIALVDVDLLTYIQK